MLLGKAQRNIALTFTIIVSCLLFVDALAFETINAVSARSQTDVVLEAQSSAWLASLEAASDITAWKALASDNPWVAVFSKDGTYLGGALDIIANAPHPLGFHDMRSETGLYRHYVVPVSRGPAAGGTLVVARATQSLTDHLLERLGWLLVTIVGASLITFLVGSRFAAHALDPARQTLRRLEQFTADASHELRNPLASAGAALDMGLKTGHLEEAAYDARAEIRRAGKLVDRLLERARVGAIEPDMNSVNLAGVVRASIHRQKPAAESRGLVLNATLADVTVECDATLVSRLVDNLLENAVRYADEGSFIRVDLTPEALTVADEGLPLPEISAQELFEPFVQGDKSRFDEGFGLGLSFVKAIADLHGWTVDGRSEDGVTTFVVHLG